MESAEKIIYAFFGAIVAVAIVSVIVSRQSQAPQAIQAFGSAISNVVASAVNPVTQAYGSGDGRQTGVAPSSLAQQIFGSSYGNLSAIVPGGFK